MPTVPTGKMERELRALYLRWLAGMPKHEDNLASYIAQFQADSMALIAREGGRAAALGALGDFPAPKLLDLDPRVGTIYNEMQQAAVKAGIATGLNSRDVARQILNTGLGQSYRKLERLARTETTNAYWKNTWNSTADLPLIVMVWGSEESKRTCDYCLSRDGLVVEDSSIRDHPNGRCTLIPTLRSRVEYKGTLRPDGSVFMDPAWTGKAPKVKASAGPTTATQRDPLSGKSNPAALHQDPASVAKAPVKAVTPIKTQATTVPPTQARVIKTTKDMDDFAKGMIKPSDLTPNAAKVLDDYAKGTAYTANAALRGQKTFRGRPIDARTKTYVKGFTKDMDKMMDKSLIPEDVRVVRAVQADAFGGLDELQKLAGGIYQDKGYMSTSLAEKVSSNVYNVKDAIEMEIDVPKGTRAVYMAGESYLRSERELLLDRGTNLAIKSVTYDQKGKKWLVKATVVPGPR